MASRTDVEDARRYFPQSFVFAFLRCDPRASKNGILGQAPNRNHNVLRFFVDGCKIDCPSIHHFVVPDSDSAKLWALPPHSSSSKSMVRSSPLSTTNGLQSFIKHPNTVVDSIGQNSSTSNARSVPHFDNTSGLLSRGTVV